MSFYPAKNADFVLFATACSAAITANPTDYNLTVGQASTLEVQASTLESLYGIATAPETRTPVSVAEFGSQRALVEKTVEAYNKIAQLKPATAEALVAAGFPVYKTSRSPQTPVTAEIVLEVVSASPNQTTFKGTNPATPTSKKKPENTGAIQLAIAIGTTAALDPSQATMQKYFTRNPLIVDTQPEQRGKIMVVWARYQSKGAIGGQKVYGAWSLPIQVSLM